MRGNQRGKYFRKLLLDVFCYSNKKDFFMSWKFVVVKAREKEKAAFRVRLRSYKKELIEEYGKPGHTSKSVERGLPVAEYPRYGFRADMSLEEAKATKDVLNASAKLEDEKNARVYYLQHKTDSDTAQNARLHEFFAEEFVKKMKRDFYGTAEEFEKSKVQSHWIATRNLILELEFDIIDWHEEQRSFYRYFIEKKWSYSYSSKIIQMLNRWGYFIARRRNAFYQSIAYPKGKDRSQLEDAFHDCKKPSKESSPLTPAILFRGESTLKEIHFNWLYISLWFGLRPAEVDSLIDGEGHTFKIENKQGKTVLSVYQSKLTSLSKDKRWKYIPVLFEEQEKGLRLICDQNFKRPLVKTIKRHLGDSLTTYGGRKGFHELMTEKGISLEVVSSWMGHASIERTWRRYRDKDKVAL
jgi:hypothetical protein